MCHYTMSINNLFPKKLATILCKKGWGGGIYVYHKLHGGGLGRYQCTPFQVFMCSVSV